jgi:hypothetical protein
MNTRRILATAVATALVLGSASAWARGGHVHGGYGHGYRGSVGVYLGAPLFSPYYGYAPWPYYGAYPYYAYPPAVVTVPTTPPVYIERAPQAVAPAPTQYWYWCADPQGYYPTVPECRQAWTPVLPQPSASQ